MRQNASPKMRQKISWQYVAAGVALVAVMVAAGVFLYLNLGNSREAKAAAAKPVVTSAGDGAWSAASSWDLRVPQSGDSILIRDGDRIELTSNTTLSGIYMGIYGSLWLENGRKLNLSEGARIEVFNPNGNIDGGKGSGAGAKIIYNGEVLWDSKMEPVVGYSVIDENGYETIDLLPVELAYFNAKMEKGKGLIEWATASETDNDYFTVERSTDGVSFEALATVPGAGTSHSMLTYTYTDASPLRGISYYRLRQTDYDQKYELFKPVSLQNEFQTNALLVQSVGPNPFRENFHVQFDLGTDGPVEVRLTNMQGQLVASETIDGYAGSNRYEFRDERGLKTGTYLLSLVQNNLTSKGVRLIKN